MKRILLISAAALSLAACGRVEPGHVGIKVNQFGSSAGVQASALGVGWYFTPFGTKIYEYPVYTSNFTWSGDDGFTFQDRNGLGLAANASVSYRVNPEKAAILFQKYRISMDAIVAGPMRNQIRNAIIEQASGMGVEEIYGPRKAELAAKALAEVQRYFEPYGLHVEQLYWASNIAVPDAVLKNINLKIANEQAALAAQANVATATANANAMVEKARGTAESNRMIAESIRTNPEIIQLKAIEQWNGAMPTYWGGGTLPVIGIK